MKRREFLKAGSAAVAASYAKLSLSQAFPARAVRLVVPFPPGGPTDIFARQYGARLATVLGQPVLIDNKAGASGAIGSMEVMRAPADGHTLLFGTASTHALYNLIVDKPQYDSVKNFAHVAILGGAPVVFVAHPSLPPTLKGVVEQARANPGKLRYGSPGAGTLMHLAAERLKREAGRISIEHIPFKGTGQSKPALLGGHVELITDTLGSSLPDHKAGRMRILAIASGKRSTLLPEVPTVDEALGTRGFEAVLWNVVAAPEGTPQAVLETLASATSKVMSEASLREQLANLGIEPEAGSGPRAATMYIQAEMTRWRPVVDAMGLKLQQ